MTSATASISDLWHATALAGGTFVSEDLTCIAAGQLLERGHLHWAAAVLGCFVGIYVGDLGLWLTGRVMGRRVLRWPWVARRLDESKLDRMGEWFDRSTAGAILASRFLPGTRLPLYLAAGTLGRRGGAFAFWTFIAAIIWAPLVVLGVAWLGEPFTRPLRAWLGASWLSLIVAALMLFVVIRLVITLISERGRQKFVASISRIWRWEFWPMCLFYVPVAVWITLLSLRRGGPRGFASISAANPGIPHGGFVGESKSQILSSICPCHILPFDLIDPGATSERVRRLETWMTEQQLTFPVILKPDVGQRGAGVKLARSLEAGTQYLASCPYAVIAQRYHPGPFEAGIFYYRMPDEPRGQIFSITDKHFSAIGGDGVSTLEELIWQHPRYRMQALTFLKRHAANADRVLFAGERFSLAIAGNHCQGTMFRDGSHLITPELETKIDSIARSFTGFYFGRFDVRYAHIDSFKRGEDLAIVEVNGVTSESTNIYDPDCSLLSAWGTLGRQWTILFRIADANIRRGIVPSTPRELWRAICEHYQSRSIEGLSD